MDRAPLAYYFDFIVFPAVAVLIVSVSDWSLGFAAKMLGGAFLFSCAEYWVHRLALHGLFWSGHHERHHTHPREYVVFPIWFTPAIFGAFWIAFPTPIFAGLVVGYCWFLIWHNALHHIDDLTRWPRFIQRYAVWHLAHHREETCNYGITLPIWDYCFGTYRRIEI